MSTMELLNISGRYSKGFVDFSWSLPNGALDTIYIYPIHRGGYKRFVKENDYQAHKLRDAKRGVRFKYNVRNEYDVMRSEFLVFLAAKEDRRPDLNELINDPKCTVSVPVGSAKVYYEIKSKKIESGFMRHTITVQSSNSLENGILGYSFWFGGKSFQVAFPGGIKQGKQKYPPFFTFEDHNVSVEVVVGKTSDVSTEEKKIRGICLFK